MMVFRTQARRIYVSYSRDWGRTWTDPEALGDFKNPNSKVETFTSATDAASACINIQHNISTTWKGWRGFGDGGTFNSAAACGGRWLNGCAFARARAGQVKEGWT